MCRRMASQIVALCLVVQFVLMSIGANGQTNTTPTGGNQPAAAPIPPAPIPPAPVPLGGLVDVDVHDTGRGKHVGVHVPLFYKMDLDKEDFGRTGLGINVLEGLVKVRVKKDPFRLKNNVFVSLADIPLWFSK